MKSKNAQELFDENKINGKKKRVLPKVFFAIFILYICLFIVFMGFVLDFRSKFICVPVEGTSMQPTINVNATNQDDPVDWVYVQKFEQIKRQDIVVFDAIKQPSDEEAVCLIKRVVALGGDAVTIKRTYNEKHGKEMYAVCLVKAEALEDGVISTDDVEELEEDYISSIESWTWGSQYAYTWQYKNFSYEKEFANTFLTSGDYEVIEDVNGVLYAKIPDGNFFYLGDNRPKSSDSRKRGTDLYKNVVGTVQIVVPDAANASSALAVQFSSVLNYYLEIIGDFFSNLWVSLEGLFAI